MASKTRVATAAVIRAMILAASGAGDPQGVTAKGPRDVVTETDVAIENALRSTADQELGITLVGEERGGAAPEGTPYWLLEDPLCGTTNFAMGIPLYCVNLAVVLDGQITAAVVGDA